MRTLSSLLIVASALGGCYRSHSGGAPRDADVRDADVRDARDLADGHGLLDVGQDPPDVALFDAGELVDAPFVDAAFIDTAVPDLDAFVAPRDAFVIRPDAFVVDVGAPDAFVVDAGPVDAFVPIDSGPPPSGTALRCTPSSLLLIPDHPRLSFGPAATLELYVRARGPGVIAIKGDAAGAHNFMLRIEGSGATAMLVGGWGNGADERLTSTPFGAYMGRWTHVALVQEDLGDTVRATLYLDGEMASTVTVLDDFTSTLSSLSFRLCTLDADLDEVRLWRVARSVAAIQLDMRRTLAPGIAFLSAYWPLEGTGQIVLDRSLHGVEGVLGLTAAVEPIDPMRISDGAF